MRDKRDCNNIAACNRCDKFGGMKEELPYHPIVIMRSGPDRDRCFDKRAAVGFNHETGRPTYDLAKNIREDETKCGMEGRWFEPWVDFRSPIARTFDKHPELLVISILLFCVFLALAIGFATDFK
ncbi:MAG: hypothetical protein CMQ40_10800 [Gammaproteobacteria bacterium]|nr:hypothetical protein [Gammaproteobacteria bacterium]